MSFDADFTLTYWLDNGNSKESILLATVFDRSGNMTVYINGDKE